MTTTLTLTREVAEKVLTTVDAGLCSGVGNPVPGQMCVEAAVCFALGQPHGDEPACVGESVRKFKIALNDSNWSSNAARALGMRRIAIAQLGSNQIDQQRFGELLALKTIQKVCPRLFRELAKLATKDEDKQVMEQAAVDCETATDLKVVATKLARARARARALDLALDLARALARALALALDLDLDLARALDLALDLDLDLDETLTLMADICLECLIQLKSPGCEWLFLCEPKEGT